MTYPQTEIPIAETAASAPPAPPADSPWVELRADRLMKAVGWMTFAYIWRVQDVVPLLAKIQLPMLVAGLSLVFYVSSRHPSRRFRLLRTPLAVLAAALLGIMLIGVPTSLWPGNSLTFAVKTEGMNLAFMGLVALSIRSVRDVEWYARVNLYGAMFYATIVNVFFRVGSDGRLGNLVYYDANDFALVMLATIPFAIFFMHPGNSARRRLIAIIGLGLLLIGIVKSGSRGGFIGLVVVLVYVALRYQSIPSRVRLFATVAGVVLIGLLGSDKYWTQISTIAHPEGDYNWTDPVGRKAVWERGVGYVEHHPLLGVGVKAFPIAEGMSDLGRSMSASHHGFKWSVAHNSFLETAAELGIPGLIVFVGFFIVAIRTLLRVKPGRRYGPWISPRELAIAQMLVGSLVGFAVAGIFVSAEYFSYLYFLLGLVIGFDKILRLRRDAAWAAIAAAGRPVRLAAAPTPASFPGAASALPGT